MLQDDAALVAQVLVGTVRARLRDEVVHVLAQTQEPVTDVAEEVSMIEVTVDDVIVHALKGEDITWPRGAHQLGLVHIVLLKEVAGKRILSIWVGVSTPICWPCNWPTSRLSAPRRMISWPASYR